MARWGQFVNTLPPDLDSRLAYLRRHRIAPLPWSDVIQRILDSDAGKELDCSRLMALGLVGSDVAYSNWLQLSTAHRWSPEGTPPEEAVRYAVRPVWFWSRGPERPELPPDGWKLLDQTIEPSRGLLLLARMLWRGKVDPPWRVGCEVDDFADSFDMDMGFVDAFRLWCMEAIDDRAQLERFVGSIPSDWLDWIDEHGPVL